MYKFFTKIKEIISLLLKWKPHPRRVPKEPLVSEDELIRLETKLDDVVQNYKKKLLAYEIRITANRLHAPRKVHDKLKNRYGEIFAMPNLSLNDVFLTEQEWRLASIVVERWLQKQGRTFSSDRVLEGQIELWLIEQISQEAQEVVKKELLNLPKNIKEKVKASNKKHDRKEDKN